MKYVMRSVLSFALIFTCSGVLLAAELDGSPKFRLDERTSVVKYSDLDLTNAGDAQILVERVEKLAIRLCKRADDIRRLTAAREQQRCLEDSYRNGIIAINKQTGVDTEALAARAGRNREIVAE